MSGDVIGRGIIEVEGDATSFNATMAQAEAAADKFEKGAVDSANKVGAAFDRSATATKSASDRFVASVEREIASISMSRSEYRQWEAQTKGVSDSVYGPLVGRLAAAKKAIDDQAEAMRQLAQAQREAAAAQANRDTFVESLRNQSAAIGKTRADLLALKAAQLGVSDQVAPYIAKLRAQDAALLTGGRTLNEYGQTTKQVQAALRGVPAQITDIFVSLQGGQSPLTVAIQQGGQLKDMFGGLAPASRALGSAVLGLLNPYSALAALSGVLIFGYARGSAEADKYRAAIAATGNVAGTTTGQLADYARGVAAVVGTQSQAAEAVAALVSSGRVARDDLQRFAQTAIETERATGTAVADTVKAFAELGKEPVEASRRLNETTNYLTLSVFEQIKALKEQNKEVEAGTLAQRTYEEELRRRASGIVENIGLFEKAWRRVKDATLGAVDAVAGIGRAQTTAEKILETQQRIERLRQQGPAPLAGAAAVGGPSGQAEIARLEQRLVDLRKEEVDARTRAANRGVYARTQTEGIEAEKEVSRIRKETATNTEKLNKELRDYRQNIEKIRAANPASALLDPARIAKDEANIREKYKEPKGPRARAFTDDAATKRLLELREIESSLRAQLATDEKLVGAEKELAKFNQLIADLKEKKVLTADQKSLLARQDEIRSQIKTNAELEKTVRLRADDAKEQERIQRLQDQFEERAAQIRQSIEASSASQRDQYDDRLDVIGLGSQAREQLQARIAIQREYQRFQQQLNKATPKELFGSDAYLEEVEAIRSAQADALRNSEEYFARLKDLQTDWSLGARAALIDYQDATARSSETAYRLVEDGLGGLEDRLATFFVKGKADWKSYFLQIALESARVNIVKPGINSLISLAAGFFGGGGYSFNNGVGTTNAAGISGGRALGGPVSPYSMHPIVERGDPELLNTPRGSYLLTGSQGGRVVPLRSAGGGDGGGITIINQSGVPLDVVKSQRLSDGERALIIDDARRGAVADVRAQIQNPNGKIRGDMNAAFRLQRNG